MLNLNRVTLVGRVGGDPEIRYLDNNVPVGRFSLATNERYRDQNGDWQDLPTEWHDIVVWRGLAERAAEEITKGKLVYVEGKINYRKWEDKDGNQRKAIDIVARQFRCFEAPPRSGGGNFPTMENDPQKPAAPKAAEAPAPPKSASDMDKSYEDKPDDGDLPF